jgi:hypothetical protein
VLFIRPIPTKEKNNKLTGWTPDIHHAMNKLAKLLKQNFAISRNENVISAGSPVGESIL